MLQCIIIDWIGTGWGGVDLESAMRLIEGVLIAAFVTCAANASWALTDRQVREAVAEEVDEVMPEHGPGGAAVAVRVDGRTLFFNFGTAARSGKPITSDSLFNLASLGKTFDTTLLSMAVRQGEVSLDDPVAKYVVELQRGGDIQRVTTSTYIGLMPEKRLGVVIMVNRCEQYVAKVGRRILLRLGLPSDVARKELRDLEKSDE